MSTRSAIGYVTKNRDFSAIFCRFDGYLGHNGHILENFYTNMEKVKRLVRMGDLIILRDDICPSMPHLTLPSKYECEINNWCEYFNPDRAYPRLFTSIESIVDYFTKANVEYIYMYIEEEKQWRVLECTDPKQEWKMLSQCLLDANKNTVDLGYNIVER